jgi:hypothetical protein
MVSLIADALLDRLVGPANAGGSIRAARQAEAGPDDLTGGSLLLKNVELRQDVLGLPVAVRGGEVGELEITVQQAAQGTKLFCKQKSSRRLSRNLSRASPSLHASHAIVASPHYTSTIRQNYSIRSLSIACVH